MPKSWIQAYRPKQVVHHLRVFQVQLHQIEMALPGVVTEGVPHGAAAAEVKVVKPAAIAGSLPVLPHILKGPKFPANMVENPIQHHPDAVFMQFIANGAEGAVVSQPFVDLVVILGVVAVLAGLEHRP